MKFEITDKFLDAMSVALNEKVRLLVFEGTIRSSKTENAKVIFYEAVQDSTEEVHLIAAEDLDAINELLTGKLGLLEMFGSSLTLVKDAIGGNYVRVKCNIEGKPQVKKILLAGFSNAAKWKKILGKTLGVILVDEANTANKQFIDECFARQVSVDAPLQLWTMNGDVPTHWIYSNYINRCKYIDTVPASIKAEMDQVKKNKSWWYMHWKMEDNPIMTQGKIIEAKKIFPLGSYYYTIKILGERGSPGRMLYIDYLDKLLIKKLELSWYNRFGIGVDIGATRAENCFSLLGFSHDFESVGLIDCMAFQQVGYQAKKEKLKAFVRGWSTRVPIEYVSIDSAEANFINDLKSEFAREGLPPIISSYKATIKQRIDLEIVLLASHRLLFNDTEEGRKCFQAFSVAKWKDNKLGEEREDNNEWHNDRLDSIEYALTRHMNKLMKGGIT